MLWIIIIKGVWINTKFQMFKYLSFVLCFFVVEWNELSYLLTISHPMINVSTIIVKSLHMKWKQVFYQYNLWGLCVTPKILDIITRCLCLCPSNGICCPQSRTLGYQASAYSSGRVDTSRYLNNFFEYSMRGVDVNRLYSMESEMLASLMNMHRPSQGQL